MGKLKSQPSRTVVLIALLVALALALDLWQDAARRRGGQTWFDDIVCAVSHPVQGVLLSAARGIDRARLAFLHAREIEHENVRLAARTAQLEAALADLRETDGAAHREHDLRSAYPQAPAEVSVARVIGFGFSGWSSYLTLDRGAADGVAVGDVAVGPGGVVGQVYAVAGRTARVVPLTDRASGIAVRVQRTRDTGVLKGLGDGRCELRYLEPDADVLPGDQVVTSGIGGVFPAGLRVGTVTSVAVDREGTGQLASVEPAAELREVEEILILPGL
jgi:rod shape-determining protein MreC